MFWREEEVIDSVVNPAGKKSEMKVTKKIDVVGSVLFPSSLLPRCQNESS